MLLRELVRVRVDYSARGIELTGWGWTPMGTTSSRTLEVVSGAVEVTTWAECWIRQADPERLEKARSWKDDRCPHCNRPHPECWEATPCLGHCGKLTTAFQSTAPGYCDFCAADAGWVSLSEVAQ